MDVRDGWARMVVRGWLCASRRLRAALVAPVAGGLWLLMAAALLLGVALLAS